MKKSVYRLSLLLSVASGLTACGPKLESVGGNGKQEAATTTAQKRETATVSVSVSDRTGLSLAAATSYSMSLEGCASGLAYPTITEANPNVDVYKFDQNCLIKLNSFTFGGITFQPSAGNPFDSWLAGDTAIFEEVGTPANTINVSVVSQLNNPVSGTEAISYSFSQIVAGADRTLAKDVVSDNHSLSVSGQDAIPMTIAGVTFQGITADGRGQFIFTLECGDNVTGTAPALSCAGTPLSSLKYQLVKDTFGGTLTMAQANALFDGSERAVADADKIAAGATPPKGGFVTKSGASILVGPAAMHSNPNMLLVVRVADLSYRYFNVDVTTLSYP